jgi:hypothetical protein
MNKVIVVGGLLAGLLVAVGCGQLVSEGGLDCPCSSGWTCCSGTCVAGSTCDSLCTKQIDLGTVEVAGSVHPVTAFSKGTLHAGTRPEEFNYGSSIWPMPPPSEGFSFLGWFVGALPGQSLALEVYAVEHDGGGPQLPVPFVTYGPIKGVGTPNCSGTLQPDAGPLQASEATEPVMWTAGVEGNYLVVPYHSVTEMDGGLTFSNFENTAEFGTAYIGVSSVDAGSDGSDAGQ